jgi:hypothetical protein
MRDLFEIGCTPHNEDCEQLGPGYDQAKAMRECRAYINQLTRVYGEPPAGAYFKVTTNYHDLGTYHEVAISFNDESDEQCDYVYGNVECGCEDWDTEARSELGLDGQTDTVHKVSAEKLGVDVYDLRYASVVPACCSAGCMVEPDETCQHGHPSVLLDEGLI